MRYQLWLVCRGYDQRPMGEGDYMEIRLPGIGPIAAISMDILESIVASHLEQITVNARLALSLARPLATTETPPRSLPQAEIWQSPERRAERRAQRRSRRK